MNKKMTGLRSRGLSHTVALLLALVAMVPSAGVRHEVWENKITHEVKHLLEAHDVETLGIVTHSSKGTNRHSLPTRRKIKTRH